MRRRASRLLLLLFAAAAGTMLGACGGGGSVSPAVVATDPPVGSVPCPALAFAGPALIAPAPGSTGVPATLSVLTFGPVGFGIANTISGNATLSGSDGTTITSGTLTRSADGTTTTASIAGLHAHTTYAVTVAGNLIERGCSFPFFANDGNFTTQ